MTTKTIYEELLKRAKKIDKHGIDEALLANETDIEKFFNEPGNLFVIEKENLFLRKKEEGTWARFIYNPEKEKEDLAKKILDDCNGKEQKRTDIVQDSHIELSQERIEKIENEMEMVREQIRDLRDLCKVTSKFSKELRADVENMPKTVKEHIDVKLELIENNLIEKFKKKEDTAKSDLKTPIEPNKG